MPEVEAPPQARRLRRPWLTLAAASALGLLGLPLLVGVAVHTGHADRADRRFRQGERVVVEVSGRDVSANRLAVAYTVAGERRTARMTVSYAEDYPVGRRYPAHLDPEGSGRIRLAKTRYDRVGPVIWASLPLVAGLLVGLDVARRWWLAARLARRGPWRPFEMWTGPETTRLPILASPWTGQAVCSPCLGLPGVCAPAGGSRPIPTHVAGDPQPGGRIVVNHGGATEIVRWTGASRRLRWWST